MLIKEDRTNVETHHFPVAKSVGDQISHTGVTHEIEIGGIGYMTVRVQLAPSYFKFLGIHFIIFMSIIKKNPTSFPRFIRGKYVVMGPQISEKYGTGRK